MTLDESNRLQRRIEELTLKTSDNEYVVKAKLQEKEQQINKLSEDNILHIEVIAGLSDKLDELTRRMAQLENKRIDEQFLP